MFDTSFLLSARKDSSKFYNVPETLLLSIRKIHNEKMFAVNI